MNHRFVVSVGSLAASIILAATAVAQTGVISGTVVDGSNKTALPGVQVAIKGTELVGVTNKDGKFTIAGVPAGSQQIEAWRVGYRNFKLSALRLAANDTLSVSFALASNAEDEAFPASAALVGIYNPVTYRSNTQPLIIIDGVIQLDAATRPPVIPPPEDIESLEIVRGAAAAALYGQRAANGVIVIKTKKR
jgi:TonB-dependent starch-binding outer membrane protein SusC